MQFARGNFAVANFEVPRSDAGNLESDKHFARPDRRHRQGMDGEHLGPAEAVDGGSHHGLRYMRHLLGTVATVPVPALQHQLSLHCC
jgi:hypothetical protein